MKQISIKTQKKIMLIPYVNIANIFIWFFNSKIMKVTPKDSARAIFLMFAVFLPLVLVQIVASEILPEMGNLLGILNAYIIPALISFFLIKHQQQLWGDN